MSEQDRRDMPIEIAMRQRIPRPIELESHCMALQRDALCEVGIDHIAGYANIGSSAS